ncbi:ATP-dependent DNA ligase [Paenibacillaceae bacterium WGS1546]|uniref:ATP-dependent DNA ligase n=1 Tax=Cohnella sp. WGS1546 TaxID=3366810 RepID=UPI00372D6269
MFQPPMLPQKKDRPFNDERYIFEPAVDGYRLQLSLENGTARLYTRYGNDVTDRYPELHRVPLEDGADALLDGSIACLDPATGSFDIELLAARSKLVKPMSVLEASVSLPVHYFVFDLLRYKGRDLRSVPLEERRRLLGRVLDRNRRIAPLPYVDTDGVSLHEEMAKNKAGGIVAKAKKSVYENGPSGDWLHIPYYEHAVVQIVGYRQNQFGWLIRHRGRDVGLLGKENGVPAAYINAFYGIAKCLSPREGGNFVYVEPRIEARIRYRGWTREGKFREPEFVDFVADL